MGAISNLSQYDLGNIFSNLPSETLPSIFPTCKSFYYQALPLYSRSLSDFWKKIIKPDVTDQDLSLAVMRLECKPEYIKYFLNVYASQNVSLQANYCKKLLQYVNKNHKNQLSPFITNLFNQCSKVFKLAALDYMNLIQMSDTTNFKWSKRTRKLGLIPKRFTHFNLAEVRSNLISTIKIHPKHTFAIDELVAVIGKTDHLCISLYFGVVKKCENEIYTIYLKFDGDNWLRAELKSPSEIGKLSPKSKFPDFCHKSLESNEIRKISN